MYRMELTKTENSLKLTFTDKHNYSYATELESLSGCDSNQNPLMTENLRQYFTMHGEKKQYKGIEYFCDSVVKYALFQTTGKNNDIIVLNFFGSLKELKAWINMA